MATVRDLSGNNDRFGTDSAIDVAEPMEYAGNYSAAQRYVKGNVVRFNNRTYVNVAASTGVAPTGAATDNANWEVLN